MSSSNAVAIYDWTSEFKTNDPTRGKVIRFITDGFVVGREKAPLPPNRQYLVIEVREGWRRLEAAMKPEWLMREPGELQPEQPYVPEPEYVCDLNGNKVNPWRYLKWLYLVEAETGVISTFEIGSVGGMMSVAELGQQIAGMRQLKGAEAIPIIELDVQPFKTKFGMKKRPALNIVGWKVANTEAPRTITRDPDDELPFDR
jgi:hypothetical protein